MTTYDDSEEGLNYIDCSCGFEAQCADPHDLATIGQAHAGRCTGPAKERAFAFEFNLWTVLVVVAVCSMVVRLVTGSWQ